MVFYCIRYVQIDYLQCQTTMFYMPTLLTANIVVTKNASTVPTTTKVLRDVHPLRGSERFIHWGSDQQLPKSC